MTDSRGEIERRIGRLSVHLTVPRAPALQPKPGQPAPAVVSSEQDASTCSRAKIQRPASQQSPPRGGGGSGGGGVSGTGDARDAPKFTGVASNTARLIEEYAMRGMVVLGPEDLGVPASLHRTIFEKEKIAVEQGHSGFILSSVPEVVDVINSPGIVKACNELVGEGWAIVPFCHHATFASGGRDQHWHKDDNGPYNARKQRHHQAVQLELLYYPQDVDETMGPTATIPFSHYWTKNHETDHDSFATDHLDFNYQIEGMEGVDVSGPSSRYSRDAIESRSTEHDVRMAAAVTETGWPVCRQYLAAPLKAGSVIIYSHNLFHRGNHRLDHPDTWKNKPRFMWRFWLYRTHEPLPSEVPPVAAWGTCGNGTDPLSGLDLSEANSNTTTVWRYHHHWLHTGMPPPPREEAAALSTEARAKEAAALWRQLHTKHDVGEPVRIGAAYKLASIGDEELALTILEKALYEDRESVRRAATYGLVAVGPAATGVLLRAVESEVKWVRKAGVFGLGDCAHLTAKTFEVLSRRLASDTSVYVRSVAAGSLGCLARRASGTGVGVEFLPQVLNAFMDSLEWEVNRLSPERAQGRSIKFVRPTDDSDVCEGMGVTFDLKRFEPVRSAVRENVLWSTVIICAQGCKLLCSNDGGIALQAAVRSLAHIVATDQNIISVGFAMDALHRLSSSLDLQDTVEHPVFAEVVETTERVIQEAPMRSWESLCRSGMDAAMIAELVPEDQIRIQV